MKKTKRGRHTTRHVELFEVEGGGKVFDTPGFTSFEIMEAGEDNLRLYYPEIERYEGQCRYDNCRHITEPDCAVREAVKTAKSRNSVMNPTPRTSRKSAAEKILDATKFKKDKAMR